LTFDDGPNPAVTPALLDLLDRYQAKATFFLIGKWIGPAAALAKEISARGHTIGNHTQTHRALVWRSRSIITEELQRCAEAIEAATALTSHWMRPPFGFRGPLLDGVARKRGERVAMWSALAYDWKPQPAARVIERLRGVRGGDIVLLHDGDPHLPDGDRHHTVSALEHWLPRWQEAGIRFVTLDAIGEK
jgi:peptidoglycan/xylan/chitin deacetylase (PgdA/CDA1 family)